MKKRLLVVTTVLSGAILAACGGGGGDGTQRAAAADLTVGMNDSISPAVKDIPFNFTRVPGFGTNTTTLTITGTDGTDTFRVTSGGKEATGNLTYGSCIFTVTNSTFDPGEPLANGSQVTIQPCDFIVRTLNTIANGVGVQRNAFMRLGTVNSSPVVVGVTITPDGRITVNGVDFGTIELKDVLTGGG